MPDRLAEHTGHNTARGVLHELEHEGAADAAAEHHEFTYAEMIHKPQLIRGECAPWICRVQRTTGFALVGIPLVHGDDVVVVLEGIEEVVDGGLPVPHA